MGAKKLAEAFPTFQAEASLTDITNAIFVDRLLVNRKNNRATLQVSLKETLDARSLDEVSYALQTQIFDDFSLQLYVKVAPDSRLKEEPVPEITGALAAEAQAASMTETEAAPAQAAPETQGVSSPDFDAAYEKELEEIRKKAQEAIAAAGQKEAKPAAGGRNPKYRSKYAPADPNVLYGREKKLSFTTLADLTEPSGEVAVHGRIFEIEPRLLKSGEKYMLSMSIYDGTDSIVCKCFIKTEDWEELQETLQVGSFVEIQGRADIDSFEKTLCISPVSAIKKTENFFTKRKDEAKVKRVELHFHSNMSEHDAIPSAAEMIARAVEWGHDAMAVTDHGVVHAFTDVLKYLNKKEIKNLKPIYGLEGYMVDDLTPVARRAKGLRPGCDTVVYTLRTTAEYALHAELFELGAVKYKDGKPDAQFQRFIKTATPLPVQKIDEYHIDADAWAQAEEKETVLREFLAFAEGCLLATYTLDRDPDCLETQLESCGITEKPPILDLTGVARICLTELKGYRLDQTLKSLGIPVRTRTRACEDAEAAALLYGRLTEMMEADGLTDLSALNEKAKESDNFIQKSPRYHIILLAANEAGRSNLYRMVSASHTRYFHNVPRIPKSFIASHREGILIGSACEAGELMRAVMKGRNERQLEEVAAFYDYLEVQPIANNGFMLREDRYDMKTEEDLRSLNRRIVDLGAQMNKPVAATCDAHFIDPEDEIYRKIIQDSRGYAGVDESTPLYFRTTDEMLAEFSYLGEEKAYEIVVENTRNIADRIAYISPVRPDKCAPVIEGAEEDLKNLCYGTAEAIYGKPLPEEVSSRLEKELQSIISNGYASLYMIAHLLVKNSNENGYLVGSRGSVGSSFVATMAGISEVNPLPPHYYCPACKYHDFDSETVRSAGSGSGCDLPEQNCPRCGQPLKKDGFSIPFETFLGFKGDKEPDIDLNFSGEYQTQAHAYTEVIFGKGHTFKAGTIGTLAEKTGYMYAKTYYEKRNIVKRQCELTRISRHLVGVRRTTGQHPGGIVVLPKGEEIHTFTPVQYPANDVSSGIITTHFDYHSIEHNLLKLDILGKDDPTVVRIMQDITGINPESIRIDDPKIMSLFQGTEALGITPEDISCPLGCLGIPEFGTDFVIQMLLDTKPKSISDLVRISGLSHGTDVWLNNAQTLIKEGKTTLEGAICTRDDIMLYLMEKGMDPAESFTIMESVRKGRGLKPEWKESMSAHQVPDWYIWSCERIQYMFPKAHAAAYVMMACRIAYYKIYHPLAYYASYLAIRGTGFRYAENAFGREKLERHFRELETVAKERKLTATEQEEIRDMKLVREMYARGFSFAPIDLYRAKADRFIITEDGRIMPSLASIDGMGAKAAAAICEEAAKGRFLSREDMMNRCRIGKSAIETLAGLGILDGMAESNQISIFDLFRG